MSDSATGKRGPSKAVVILLIVIAVLVAGGGVTVAWLLLGQDKDGEGDEEPARTIGYQNEGIIIVDENDLDKIPPPAGMIDLNYKNVAESTDGVNFTCEIANSASNEYDMYFTIYLDETFEDQLLLTGLVPPGGEMRNFTSEIPLENGIYETVLTMTQVDDDHGTIVGQVSVVLNLYVYDESKESEENEENEEE